MSQRTPSHFGPRPGRCSLIQGGGGGGEYHISRDY